MVERGKSPACSPGATTVPLHVLPPRRGPPRHHRGGVTATGEAAAGGPGHRSCPCCRLSRPHRELAAARTAGGRCNDPRLVIKPTAASLAQPPPRNRQLLLLLPPPRHRQAGGAAHAAAWGSRGARAVLPGPGTVPEKGRAAPGRDAAVFLNGGGSWTPRALCSLAGANGRS